jgi:hypothetical protein
MKFDEHIKWLASANSGSLYPKEFEEIDKTLPYFKVSNKEGNNYTIDMFNYKTHDNADRMPYVCDFLLYNVFPHVKSGNLSGYYSIQLHDTYTYLNDGKNYKDVLCFGKYKIDKGPVMIPDCYFMGDWGGKYHNIIDPNTWDIKQNKIVFGGTTTGSRNPKLNQRIQTCLWAIDKPSCDFYITNVAQIPPQQLLNDIPNFDKIYKNYISLEQQMSYRYILNIDGNTVKWNPDYAFTNSLGLCMPSNDMLWYSTLLHDNIHYKEVDLNNMLSILNYYQNNKKEALFIIENANKLAKTLFKKSIAIDYMIELFDNIAGNK